MIIGIRRFASEVHFWCSADVSTGLPWRIYSTLPWGNKNPSILAKMEIVAWGFASPVSEESYNGHVVSLKMSFQLQRMIFLGASWAIGCIHLTDVFSWIFRMCFLLCINANEYTKASGKIYIFLQCINNLYKVSAIPKPWKI